jgi:acetolactate synthase I/II/III large subunit
VHIDALRVRINNAYNPAVELVGDIAATQQLFTPLISHSGPNLEIQQLLTGIAEERTVLAASAQKMNGVPIHPLRLVFELQQILTPDMTLCSDMGSFHIWLTRHLYSFRARQVLISNG